MVRTIAILHGGLHVRSFHDSVGMERFFQEQFQGDWHLVSKKATSVALSSVDIPENRRMKKLVRACGRFMEMLTAVAFRSWRLMEDSPTIAAEYGAQAVQIRVILHRLRAVAESLGFDCGKPHWNKGRRYSGEIFTEFQRPRSQTLRRNRRARKSA